MKDENITLSKELTKEEAAVFKAPENIYEDEQGNSYQLLNWELEEKMGKEKKIPVEKQVRYLGLEDEEEIPETIDAKMQPQQSELSGTLYKAEITTLQEQWKDDLYLPVTFYSYGADEYQLGEITISAEDNHLLEAAAQEGELILNDIGLSSQAYHITSMVWNGEPFTDKDGQLCRNAIALGERLLKDVEVVYRGEAGGKEPDYYELHAVYQLEEKESGSTVELMPETLAQQPDLSPDQGSFWYLIRTGFVITIAIGILGILIGILLLLITKRRKKEEKDHF